MSSDLIERIREQPADQHRWAAWYKSIYPRLYYVAFRLASGNAEVARDLVQEAFERFISYRAIGRVSNDQHALSFLMKTCRNLAYDHKVQAHPFIQESPEELESIAEAEQPIDAALDFDRMIQALEPQDRELIEWARDGMSLSEIAAKLGVTYSAAGVRLHRIRKRLRNFYEHGVKIPSRTSTSK